MPLNKNEDTNPGVSTQSALVELTLMEYEKDLPKDQMERCQTHHLTSCVPLGWVDGILRPLPIYYLFISLVYNNTKI